MAVLLVRSLEGAKVYPKNGDEPLNTQRGTTATKYSPQRTLRHTEEFPP